MVVTWCRGREHNLWPSLPHLHHYRKQLPFQFLASGDVEQRPAPGWDVYGQDAPGWDVQDALRWDPVLGREGLLQGGPALRWEEAGGKEGWWSSWSTKTEHKLSRLKTVDTDTLRMQLSGSQVSLKCTHPGLSLSRFLEVRAAQSWIEGMRHS